MSRPHQSYTNTLLGVTVAHGLLLGALLAIPFIHGCEDALPDTSNPMELIVEPPPNDLSTPIEVMKDVPHPAPDKHEETVEDPKDDPPPDKDDVPLLPPKPKDKIKKPDPKPKDKETKKPEDKPGKIKVNKTLVKRPLPNGKGKLTPEEVRKLLDRGAKLGKHSTLSADDMRRLLNGNSRFADGSPVSQEFVVLDMVRQAMYRAWDQPTALGIAGLVTKVELTISSSGLITASRMIAGSGNATMDASVMRAIRSVRRIPNLPASYINSHPRIPISFELTGNN